MKKSTFFLVATAMASLVCGTSCEGKADDGKQAIGEIESERDSLALVNEQLNVELEQMFEILNEIEDGFDNMKAAQNYVTIQSEGEDRMSKTTQERVREDMRFIAETLQKQRERIAELEKKLRNARGGGNNPEMKKMIERLKAQLDAKDSELAALKSEIAKKNKQIEGLNTDKKDLQANVQSLEEQTKAKDAEIKRQIAEMNKVYYCFGTPKELKEQKILVNGQLGQDFDTNYFILADKTQLKAVPLFALQGKLVSKHPAGSYNFVKGADGKANLQITNAEKFWSLTKYLIVEVKV